MAPFHIIDIFDDVDDMLYAFEQFCTEILNEDAPLKQAVIRRNQVPYITEEWRKEIRYRNNGRNLQGIALIQIIIYTKFSVTNVPP